MLKPFALISAKCETTQKASLNSLEKSRHKPRLSHNPNNTVPAMKYIDLNADLGESFGPWNMGADRAMLDIVNSANIACGGHAGDNAVMLETIQLAQERNVKIGAHPGFDDKQGFGRRRIPLSMPEVEQLIAAQVGTIRGIAALAGAEISYVKPHGALNNWACENDDVANAIARAMKQSCPELAMLAVSGTKLETASRNAGIKTYSEVFADRGYGDDGNLVLRGQEGAMITDAGQAADRLIQFFETGEMPTASGGTVKLAADSICIHGDSDHAVDMAVQLRAALVAHGFELRSFVDA